MILVKYIGANAFEYNCLSTIVIPANISGGAVTTDDDGEKYGIEDNAFGDEQNPVNWCSTSGEPTSIKILGDEDRFNTRWTSIGFPENLCKGDGCPE